MINFHFLYHIEYSFHYQAVYWIPENFPSSCVTVVSTLCSDTETVQVLSERKYVTIEMETLPHDSQQEMCVVSDPWQSNSSECSQHMFL